MKTFFDLIIVGSGVAGLSALLASDKKQTIAVVSPGSPLETGSSWRAQGGVAVALGQNDSPTLHAEDTMIASRQMADPKAVACLTEIGTERVAELLADGLAVDKDDSGRTLFGLEAAHCRARVIHQKDHTGKALVAHLWQRARERQNTVFLSEQVSALLTDERGVTGVLLSDGTSLATPRVILATGGFAGLYEATTTGREVRGAGLVLAAQAGAKLKDLEFVQFHPTALDLETEGPLPLLTEALRGAGATLKTPDGERFIDELRPRDEVARAIAAKRREGFGVYLDLKPVEDLAVKFPGAHSQLLKSARGKELLLPVRPAAHYTIGGVATDLDGLSNVAGLYACGEVASVGVHGANRLASNSLLEGLVFGHRAGRHASSSLRVCSQTTMISPLRQLQGPELVEFRAKFEAAVGVVRTGHGLSQFLDWLDQGPVTVESELAKRVATAALQRKESVGAHFREDSDKIPTSLVVAG